MLARCLKAERERDAALALAESNGKLAHDTAIELRKQREATSMPHLDLAVRLIRLNRHKVGLTEACTLFALGGGSTLEQLGKALGANKRLTQSRLFVIINKGLVEQVTTSTPSPSHYRPTEKGARIIRETLKGGVQ